MAADVTITSEFDGSTPSGGGAPGLPTTSTVGGAGASGSSMWSALGKATPWLVGGAASLGGAVIGGLFGAKADKKNRAFNKSEAELQREWASHERDTAWQDTVADLRAAGINPMHMFAKGGSATPVSGGSSANYSGTASVQGAIAGAHVANTLASAKLMNAQAAKTEAEIPSIAQGIRESEARTASITKGLEKITEEIWQIRADISVKERVIREIEARIIQLNQLTEKYKHETSSAQSASRINSVVADFQTKIGGDIERWSKSLGVSPGDLLKFIPNPASTVIHKRR